MKPHPKHHKARDTAPNRCRRCPRTAVVRLSKTRRSDNDVYRCTRCGLIFSPSTQPKPVQNQPNQPPNKQPHHQPHHQEVQS